MPVAPLPPRGRLRVVQLITKRDIGGAQLTALDSCRVDGIDVSLWVGGDDDSHGAFTGAAWDRGVDPVVITGLHRRIGARDMVVLVDLVRRLRLSRPDLIHTHSSKAGVLGRVAAVLAGVPAVHTVHGWSFHDGMGRVARWAAVAVERLLARKTAAIVVVTTTDRDLGLANRIGRVDQYHVIRSGLDLSSLVASARPDLRRELGLDDTTPLIGTVGRLAPQKDPLLLLDAFEVLAGRRPDVHIAIVGDGPMCEDVKSRVRAMSGDVAGRIHLIGARPDAAALIGQLDVFVLTSRWEGLPRTVIEAMALRTPVVSVAVNGVTEVVTSRTGWPAVGRTADAVAEAADEVLHASAADRTTRLDAAQDRAGQFSVEQMRADLQALWSGVAGSAAAIGTAAASALTIRGLGP